jgi:zinc D-Ala-D-Ala carboxypeptidase
MDTFRSTFSIAVSCCALVACGPTGVPEIDGQSFGSASAEGEAELALTAAQLQWPVLREGMQSDTVVALQYLLRFQGQTVTVDGDFGPQTATAAQRAGRASPINGTDWVALTPLLRSGTENAAVRAAQHLLKEKYGANLAVTGLVGPTTQGAIADFQRGRCLAPDGIVGVFTWHALISGYSHCTANNTAGLILAQHQAGTITLWDETFGRLDGADPLSNIKDAAAGRAAKTSCHGGAPCDRQSLQPAMLNGLLKLQTRYNRKVFVTTINGAAHSPTSYHYAGRAFDIDEIDGVKILGNSARARAVMAECRALGAIEVLGPSNDPNHYDHIHCAF